MFKVRRSRKSRKFIFNETNRFQSQIQKSIVINWVSVIKDVKGLGYKKRSIFHINLCKRVHGCLVRGQRFQRSRHSAGATPAGTVKNDCLLIFDAPGVETKKETLLKNSVYMTRLTLCILAHILSINIKGRIVVRKDVRSVLYFNSSS